MLIGISRWNSDHIRVDDRLDVPRTSDQSDALSETCKDSDSSIAQVCRSRTCLINFRKMSQSLRRPCIPVPEDLVSAVRNAGNMIGNCTQCFSGLHSGALFRVPQDSSSGGCFCSPNDSIAVRSKRDLRSIIDTACTIRVWNLVSI